MKKFFMLSLVILMVAVCSSDDSGATVPDGQYTFQNDTMFVAVKFNGGVPYKFDAFVRGGSVAQFNFTE